MNRILFTIPGKPVSVNAAYRRRRGKGGGIMKSQEATDYFDKVVSYARMARGTCEPMTGDVEVTLRIFFANRQPDADGPVKGILDAMQSPKPPSKRGKGGRNGAAIYVNDRQVRKYHVDASQLDADNPRVEVEVEAIGPQQQFMRTSSAPADGLFRSSVRRYGGGV